VSKLTSLREEFLNIPAVELGGQNSLPNFAEASLGPIRGCLTDTEEDDGLFNDYGYVRAVFPYRMQDCYTREFTSDGFKSIVLENEHLKATFVPDVGGKLWRLYDKDNKKDLLFNNPVFRPANLALRNAWTSGGVEWNLGWLGHHPYTCSRLHTALTKLDDSTPVLRMYEYERVRGLVYQMDFWLPDDSKFLYCRMRITNPKDEMTPAYWWSNIAVEHIKGSRLITNADITYNVNNDKIHRYTMPKYSDDKDISYPETIPTAQDHFFPTRDGELKYETMVNPDGYGLIQASTSRLKGRKIFVWGQGTGGRNFQKFLSGNDCDGAYFEIQAGLACSQTENLPMPAKTVWEWVEVYGPLQIESKDVDSEWFGLQDIVRDKMNENGINDKYLEEVLVKTRPMAKRKAEKKLFDGSGWANLENLRREADGEEAMCPHLDFKSEDTEPKQWIELLEKGSLGEHNPFDIVESWMLSDKWITKMEKAVKETDSENWYTYLQLGCAHLMQGDGDVVSAEKELRKSINLKISPWALYALGHLYRMVGKELDAVLYLEEAYRILPTDCSLAKSVASTILKFNMYERLYKFCVNVHESLQEVPRIRMYKAIAAVKIGDLKTAEEIFYRDEVFEIPDQREGEVSLTELWYDIEELRAKQRGEVFDRENIVCPEKYNFRMSSAK